MKTALKAVGILLGIVVVLGVGVFAWASFVSTRTLSRTFEAHAVDFPIPFPVPPEEAAEMSLTQGEAEALARERALERGRHLIRARYGCAECHGEDFGGGVMVDAFPIGRLLGPNLTSGEGGVVADYTPRDWDRIVRHGIRPDGRPAAMPSEDFFRMSDQELSDIIFYISSFPPVDNVVPPVSLGPLGKFLVATGQIHLSADMLHDHDPQHRELPPPPEVNVEFGGHLAAVCTGCHRMDFAGGPVAGGDPSWVPAANLTPHPEGLAGWSYQEFVAAMRDGVRPDGTPIREPMSLVSPFAQNMTDVEMEAIWVYLGSLEPRPTGR
jgi:mono/diheme cytochrome c family protein